MRALTYDGILRLDENAPDPVLEESNVLLKMRRAGICSTDFHLMDGYLDFSGIPGHEFVADVIDGAPDLIGKRVVGEINVADGDCEYCRRGIPEQCLHRSTIGIHDYQGAFADYLQLPVRNLHIVPDNVSDDQAVFTEPLAAALQVTEAIHISPRDTVVVIGIGRLGMLVAQILKLTGANVIGVVRREKQAKLLKSWHIKSAGEGEVAENSAQVVVDVTGNPQGFEQALRIVKPRGTIIIKSTYVDGIQADLTKVMVDEIRIVGSRCGPFDAALRLLSAGLIDTQSLIDARYDFNQAIQAMDYAKQKGIVKVLLDF